MTIIPPCTPLPAVLLPVVSARCEPLTNTPPVSQMWQQVSTPGSPLDHCCPGPSPALGCGPATRVLLFVPLWQGGPPGPPGGGQSREAEVWGAEDARPVGDPLPWAFAWAAPLSPVIRCCFREMLCHSTPALYAHRLPLPCIRELASVPLL